VTGGDPVYGQTVEELKARIPTSLFEVAGRCGDIRLKQMQGKAKFRRQLADEFGVRIGGGAAKFVVEMRYRNGDPKRWCKTIQDV
jgi:hypothetical protein